MTMSPKKIIFKISALLSVLTLVGGLVLVRGYLNTRDESIAPLRAEDLARAKKGSDLCLWLRALKASILFTLGIGLVWYLATDDIAWKNVERTLIIDQASLEAFKRTNIREALRNRQALPIYIPTDVFVQSIEFTSANNVILTGYIWQHYHEHVPDDLSRGFVLPEAESSEMTEAYRRKEKDGEVIGWYFHVTLRQDFDYTRYPFDQQTVWMRLWHQDFDKNVVLLPALDSYDFIHPERLPGIEQDFVLPGWKVTSRFASIATLPISASRALWDKSSFRSFIFKLG